MSSSLEDEKKTKKIESVRSFVGFDCGVETRCGVQRGKVLRTSIEEEKRKRSGVTRNGIKSALEVA
jgi:hypothetical protein